MVPLTTNHLYVPCSKKSMPRKFNKKSKSISRRATGYCPPPACTYGLNTYSLLLDDPAFIMKKFNEEESKKENFAGSYSTKENVPTAIILYKDCRKNHAANIGRHAVDGCCEFMPAGDAGSPGAFLCAACNCHRNFHRKVVLGPHDTSSCDCSSISTAPK